MSYRFSDQFYPTSLNVSLNASTSDDVIQVDTLDGSFADDVRSGGEFPLRIGRGQNQERVLVTAVQDEANNKLKVERNAGPYGLKSHPAGSRVAHAMPAGTAQQAVASRFEDAALASKIQVLRAALKQLQMEWSEVVKSGDGAQKVYQLSHGLGAVPGLAQVQERSSAAAKEFYVSNRTSNYVEITFATAPASGTDNLIFGLLVGLAG